MCLRCRLPSLHSDWRPRFRRAPFANPARRADGWRRVWVPGRPGRHEVPSRPSHCAGWVRIKHTHAHTQIQTPNKATVPAPATSGHRGAKQLAGIGSAGLTRSHWFFMLALERCWGFKGHKWQNHIITELAFVVLLATCAISDLSLEQMRHKQRPAFVWYHAEINVQVFWRRAELALTHHPKYSTRIYTLEPKQWTQVLPEITGPRTKVVLHNNTSVCPCSLSS